MFRSLALPLALALAGCGGAPAPLVAVKGQVRLRGHALAGGTVVFVPDAERGARGPLAVAEVGPDGRFELHTGAKSGCTPGWHKVTVGGRGLSDRYRDPDLSGQRVEVRAAVDNHCDIQLD